MFSKIRNSKAAKVVAAFLALNLLAEIVTPLTAFALTSGPSQPEVQSFEPVGTNQMVDIFSGDFTYNIPLLDVGGYPINISYHSGIGMEQDASWVGLGWNINPGVINRSMRGIPDDFNGTDKIKKTFNIKPNWNLLLKTNIGNTHMEMFGAQKMGSKKNNYDIGIYYNNYKGLGVDFDYRHSWNRLSLSAGYNTSTGIDVTPTLGLGKGRGSFNLTAGYNSTYGMQYLAAQLTLDGHKKSKSESVNNSRPKSVSYNNGHSLSGIAYFNPSYMPVANPDMFSSNYDLSLKFGRVSKGFFSAREIDANLTVSGVRKDKAEKEVGAYGYFYLNAADENGLMDFNRDNEVTPHKQLDYLPTTILTHDIYSVSGQGTGGIFRPFRSRVGKVADPSNVITFSSPNVGIGPELGLSPNADFHFGLDLKTTVRHSSSKKWDADVFDNYSYLNPSVSAEYEDWYFKSAGEKTLVDDDFYQDIGESKAIRVELDGASIKKPKNELKTKTGTKTPDETVHAKREKRNQPIFSLTAAEKNYCLEKDIFTYSTNENNQVEPTLILRSFGVRKSHHVTEVTSINTDGSRYVYGLPAYNTLQKDVVFAIDKSGNASERLRGTLCNNKEQISYSPGSDNHKSNANGIDNFFMSTETPPYAHSYMLTAVLSPDYVDVDNNGPSDNDLGSYTHIKYTRVTDNYKWRSPFNENKANFLEGNKSDKTDDKASYVYGEKEIWHIYSIETKTHIAEFILNDPSTEPRQDGKDVDGEDGGAGSAKLRYLKKIVLYAKEDRLKNGVNAIPVKTVHFTYNYSLCQNVPYNQSATTGQKGKLTLESIWFTYGNTLQGALSPYTFTYSTENPDYDPTKVDRWGTYKNHNCADAINDEFSYTEQNKTNADANASAWNLTEIQLPSGGTIEVTYESDDYAYVQDKQAMQMFNVIGLGTTNQFNKKNNLLYEHGFQKKTNRYIFFELPPGINSSNIQEKLMPPENGIYFKFLVDLDNKGKYEYVSGYCSNGNQIGVDNTSGTDVGYIYIEAADLSDNNTIDVNPVSKAAWQKTRVELPHLVHPETDQFKSGSPQVEHVAKSILGVFPRLAKMITGINLYMLERLYGQKVKFDGHSVIRLLSPGKTKLGGGHRVKQILLTDEWDDMTSSTEESQTTGQVYDYITKDNSGNTMSSGVASYEPMLGGEENPFKYPIDDYRDIRVAAINDVFHIEGPIGESFYPAPSVGYSRVSVRNIKPSDIGIGGVAITRHGTGKSVYEFYTAYDFPVTTDRLFDRKDMTDKNFGGNQILSALGLNIDYKALTQGFAIVLNDMHGKPKAKYDFAEGNDISPVSYVKYKYKVNDEHALHKSLDNSVTVLNRDGTVGNKQIGIETELVFDTQKDEEYGGTLGFEPNFNVATLITTPVPVFTMFFNYSNFYAHQYRRASATKLVNMYGILDEVEVKEDGAIIITKNIAYDAETGVVLLTHTQNEYSDDIYNMTYPAHWAYEGMGPAYVNTGLNFSLSSTSGGYATVTQEIYDLLAEGDELVRTSGGTSIKVWVLKKLIVSSQYKIILIDSEGKPIADGSTQGFKVMRSGRRNLQNTPVGSFVSTANPINSATNKFADPADFEDNVINASATEFSDKWQMYTDKPIFGQGAGQEVPLTNGAVTFLGFLQNMIISGELLNDGEKIEDYVNSPVTNSKKKEEKTLYAMELGLISVPPGPSDPDPDISALEWNIVSTFDNTLTAEMICSPGSCNGCDMAIKMYEPSYGNTRIPKDISTFLPTLTFNSSVFTTQLNVTYDFTLQKYKTSFKLKATNGKYYEFEVLLDCFNGGGSSCHISYDGKISNLVKDNLFNPYIWNIKGTWAPKKSLVYYDTRNTEFERKSITSSTEYNLTDMRVDGKLDNFIPYWYKETAKTYWTPEYKVSGYTPWTWNNELSVKNSFGLEMESKNALNIYSSALFGNNNTLPIAVASNARLNQICYDGFEEPADVNTNFEKYHFGFLFDAYKNIQTYGCSSVVAPQRVQITSAEAHSGKNSVEILKAETGDNGCYINLGNSLSVLTAISDINWLWPSPNAASSAVTDPNFSKLQESDIVKPFSPATGDYLLSYWVKEEDAGTLALQLKYKTSVTSYGGMVTQTENAALNPCDGAYISGFNTNYADYYLEKNPVFPTTPSTYSSITYSIESDNIIINGWKRVLVKFTVPSNAVTLKINFINTSTISSAFVDDFRVFPYDANMKSFAYDYYTRRLLAELDENNYATFYEYDDMGNLVRVKRETDEGIVTINENRQNVKK